MKFVRYVDEFTIDCTSEHKKGQRRITSTGNPVPDLWQPHKYGGVNSVIMVFQPLEKWNFNGRLSLFVDEVVI
jgi:hypothetical protein